MTIRFVETCALPTAWGTFQLHAFEEPENDKVHLALALGEWQPEDAILLRVHSECLTGDALGSQRCDCGSQLQVALQKIGEEGRGLVLYLRQEGRGIGLLNKIRAYALQDEGADTVEANERLGFGADMRDYSICQPMLKHLRVSRARLMTNNPRKISALEELGVKIEERIPHHTGLTPHNEIYLQTKKGKLGHQFE